ncbi:hypothetical protein [Companilactobacillus sp.]|uniref:hypothetical protein n=1 Tax=Companilactobacillus sp. TaxID=2767905 RepID=UPI0025B97C13|nr:hypothetical protein [Companilactobacillus sp.]MCH4009486.1 hypothetical protein [Companilactobacillus sp.]MCH4052838.1 hypothetical protein [Companilactobacillus sp.]MCH4077428.1 hypothetical protein [Companilactobacillus sp.]MCH4126004.1 hypothetical protein [Companilactobacillus sp.]MCI1311712.1 hypothetical protein [Companilactobacillus sp.]
MKKSIIAVVTSFALLLAGGTLSTSVSNAATNFPDTYRTSVHTKYGTDVYVNAHRVSDSVNLRTKHAIMAGTEFDGTVGLIANQYGDRTNLTGSLYYDSVTDHYMYLINDPSTYLYSWVSPDDVEIV